MAMTDKKIEEYLAEAIEKNTPDILDQLMADLDKTDAALGAPGEDTGKVWEEVRAAGDYEMGTQAKAPAAGRWMKALISLAAVFVLLIGGSAIYTKPDAAFAVVGIDVNPSIELTLNKDEIVTGAKAINAEGEEILSGMNLEKTDVNTACNAILGSMLSNGYLTQTSNSVLVSVRAEDAARGKEIEEKLAQDLSTYLGESELAASVMGQYVDEDDALEAFAEANGISEGKAWLIRNLLATGSTKMTEESLLRMSTQELILLGQERSVNISTTYGSADTSKYITRDSAIETALKAAGISAGQASGTKAELDADDGRLIYEVEFTSGGREYEYDVDAVTGKIAGYETEVSDGDDSDDDMDGDDADDAYDTDDDDDLSDRDDDHDDHDDRYDRDDDDCEDSDDDRDDDD